MHREIQIKQFPIVTTHWWPKTRNERFVWENEQYLYRFLPLVHNHVQVIWVHTRIRCVTCGGVCARSGSSASTLDGGRVWSVVLTQLFQAPTEASANQIASCKYPIPFMQHQRSMWLVVCNYDGASGPRFRHALQTRLQTPTSQSARTHTSHTHVTHTRHTHTSHTHTHQRHTPECVCALRSLGHGCVQEVKNDINTVRFLTQTARFVS